MIDRKQAARKRLKTLRAKAAARKRVARPDYDPRKATQACRAGYWLKLMQEVDPAGELTEDMRLEKAKVLFQAKMDEAKANKLARSIHAMRKAG
jgi:hypothetical protein